MKGSSFSKTEKGRLEELARTLARETNCGLKAGGFDYGADLASIAEYDISLINKDFDEFDSMFVWACDDLSLERNYSIPVEIESFPRHNFVLFANVKDPHRPEKFRLCYCPLSEDKEAAKEVLRY